MEKLRKYIDEDTQMKFRILNTGLKILNEEEYGRLLDVIIKSGDD